MSAPGPVLPPSGEAVGPGSSDEVTDGSLLRLRDDLAVEDAVARRQTARELQDRALEVATWVGALRDLAERGDALVVHLDGGDVHRGWIQSVGIDHLALRRTSGGVMLVPLAGVRAVRPEPGVTAPAATGDRARSQDRTLLEAVQALVAVGDQLAVGVRDLGAPLQGRLLGLGEDVLSLRVVPERGGTAGTVYVPAAAIREVVLA